jgi:hypothetical protein
MNLILDSAMLALLNPPAGADPKARLDSVDPDMVAADAASHAIKSISLQTAATVQQWCETDDLAEGEGAGDRLFAMLVGIADDNKDGELSDAEQAVVDVAMNEAWSYMAAKGVAESDLDTLFNAEDPAAYNDAGARVMEFMADKLPDGDEAAGDEMDDFAFGADAQEGIFDSAGNLMLDAVYKKRFAIRGGKKMIVRKRVSGHVRLSAKQKVSIRKAGLKSRSAGAMVKRMKSLRVRKSMNLGAHR